jgi:hypothetical protein
VDITLTTAGAVNVTIQGGATGFSDAVERKSTVVTVYKSGVATPITFTAAPNGTAGTVTTTEIIITFSKAVADLAANDITITNGPEYNMTGNVDKAGLTMTGTGTNADKVYKLEVTVNTAGTIRMVIAKGTLNIDNTPVTVTVHKNASAPFVVPDSGSNDLWVWTKITEWDFDIEGGDQDTGKGNIIGDDFAAILGAAQWKNTYLRIYYTTVDGTTLDDYPGLAIGNVDGTADDNLLKNLPTLGRPPAFMDVDVKDIIKYINPASDDYLYINNWSGAIILGALLYVPADPQPIDVLDDGVSELTVPGPTDEVRGKGFFGSAALNAINAADDKAYLMVTIENSLAHTAADAGEIGTVMGSNWGAPPYSMKIDTNTGKIIPPVGTEAGGTFTFKIMVANLKYAFKLPLSADLPQFGFNLGGNTWGNAYISQILLYDSPACDDETVPPPPETPWPPIEIDWPDFDSVTKMGEGGGSNEWPFNTASKFALLKTAKYFIIATRVKPGTASNPANFNSMQFVIKSAQMNNWNPTGNLGTNAITSFDRTPVDEFTYVVFKVTDLPDWATTLTTVTNNNASIGVQYGADQLGYYCGYITDIEIDTTGWTPGEGSDSKIFFTKDLGLDAAPDPMPNFLNLAPYFDGDKRWLTNGTDGAINDFAIATLQAAKYLVLSVNSKYHENGYGGLQVVWQGDNNWSAWNQSDIPPSGWNEPAWLDWDEGDDPFYFVIPLADIANWTDVSACTQVKIILNTFPGQIELKTAYLTDKTLVKPASDFFDNAVGWAARDVPEGHN